MEPNLPTVLSLMCELLFQRSSNDNLEPPADQKHPTDETLEHLWRVLRPVSKDMRRIAARLWQHRLVRLERSVHCRLDAAMAAVFPIVSQRARRCEVFAVLVDMAVLQGTAQLMMQSLVTMRPAAAATSAPRTLRDLRSAALEGFDLPALEDLSLSGMDYDEPFSFRLISECLLRAGEMRVFVGGIDGQWASVDAVLNRAAEAYTELQMHHWAWPAGAKQGALDDTRLSLWYL